MRRSRRTVLKIATPALAGVAGCTGLFSPKPKARPVVDSGATVQDKYVVDQPTYEEVPAVEGYLATTPEEMNDILRWDQLIEPQRRTLRAAQERFESGKHFFTAVVGALYWEYALTDYKDARLRDRTMQFFTKPYDTDGPSGDDTGTEETPPPEYGDDYEYPEYNYDYSFYLWKLSNDTDPPTGIEVKFRPGEMPTVE